MILSKRLDSIAKLINNNSSVIDVGCDHGLLDIYLAKYKNCFCTASDISEKCINKTQENIIKYKANNIKTAVSDGLNNINICNNDIIVISGMGTSTIKGIIKATLKNDLIIQSNNDYYELREYLYLINYHLVDEEIVYDKNKFYITMYFKKGNKKITDDDLFIGPILKTKKSSIQYYNHLLNKYYKIIDDLPKSSNYIISFKKKVGIIEKTLDQLQLNS